MKLVFQGINLLQFIKAIEGFCYPKQGEALEQECIKLKDLCVDQRMQEEDKMIKHVETCMHACKCEEKNDDSNCISEKVVETSMKSIGEHKKLIAKYFLEEEIIEDQTAEDKVDL